MADPMPLQRWYGRWSRLNIRRGRLKRDIGMQLFNWSHARPTCPSKSEKEAERWRDHQPAEMPASSQESYGHAIDEFIGWYCSEPRLAFSRTVVLRYRFFLEQKNLAPSTINASTCA